MDAAVRNLTVTTGVKFDGTGRAFTVTRYTFFVGTHGPFTLEYWPGRDTPAQVQADIQARVDSLRVLGAVY